MSGAFLIQFFASLVAIGLLVGLARWIGRARPTSPLDEALARALFAEEFPDMQPEGVYIARDRRSALARSGDEALIVYQAGDGWVARAVPWSWVAGAQKTAAAALINLADPSAPRLKVAVGDADPWPPSELCL